MLKQTLLLAALLLMTASLMPQDSPPLDGPKRPFNDELMDNLAGKWHLTGTIMGRAADHEVEAEWVLNHQFLRIHEKAVDPKAGDPPYEAIVMVGYDNTSERYVAHWLDIFGGRFSETLGYGQRRENAVEFLFEYPDGPFRTTFRWLPDKKQWQWVMKTKGKNGQWTDFGTMTLTRQEPR